MKYLILFLLFVSCSKVGQTVTAKHKIYWLKLRKQNDLQLDSLTYEKLNGFKSNKCNLKVDYIFILDGEIRIAVSEYNYNQIKEGEIYYE